MGYDLRPNNKVLDTFHMGAFTWPILLEGFGYLFSSIHKDGRYFFVTDAGNEGRMGTKYPRIISNDGFPVTEEEAKIMARMARNMVLIHRYAEKDNAYLKDYSVLGETVWPMRWSEDFTRNIEKFAEWADQSGGFEVR